MPNPFYQVYAVAALSVGAEPVLVPATPDNGHLPDYAGLPAEILNRTALVYLCSPANPQGAVASESYWRDLIALAEKHDFRILADECYSDIWRDAAPVGALQVAHAMGADPERVAVFHSLSKRSNLPGLRSGFVATGPQAIHLMRSLRNYAGAPLPLPLQRVAEKVWADEAHVTENRALYQQKYRVADQVLSGVPGYQPPPAGFFLWLPVDDGEQAALRLWRGTGVRVLPGGYLGREVDGENPAKGFIRVAMVAPTQDMQRGLTLLRDCLYE
jgi:aspartate/methionine/tyrosine aminotransferase